MDLGLKKRLGLLHGDQGHALDALNQDVDGLLGAGHFLDEGAGADLKQVGRTGLLDGGIALGNDHQGLFLVGQAGLDGGHGAGPAHRQRHEQVRKQHRVLDRQDGQGSNLDRPARSGGVHYGSASI